MRIPRPRWRQAFRSPVNPCGTSSAPWGCSVAEGGSRSRSVRSACRSGRPTPRMCSSASARVRRGRGPSCSTAWSWSMCPGSLPPRGRHARRAESCVYVRTRAAGVYVTLQQRLPHEPWLGAMLLAHARQRHPALSGSLRTRRGPWNVRELTAYVVEFGLAIDRRALVGVSPRPIPERFYDQYAGRDAGEGSRSAEARWRAPSGVCGDRGVTTGSRRSQRRSQKGGSRRNQIDTSTALTSRAIAQNRGHGRQRRWPRGVSDDARAPEPGAHHCDQARRPAGVADRRGSGHHPTTLSRLVSGSLRARPNDARLLRVAEILGVPHYQVFAPAVESVRSADPIEKDRATG